VGHQGPYVVASIGMVIAGIIALTLPMPLAPEVRLKTETETPLKTVETSGAPEG
jgi:hypothetical protein